MSSLEVDPVVAAYDPEAVYLFGSRVRGDASPDSDCDIVVIVSESAPPELRRSRLAYQVLWDTGAAADVLVWTREAFVERLRLRASLPAVVLSEGKLLYGSLLDSAR